MITCMPSASLTGALLDQVAGQVTDSDMSAAGSRNIMNATVASAEFIWAICPSTHTVPSLSMHSATRMATARTGQGLSGDYPLGVTLGRWRSLRGRAGDPVGQQRLERCARLGGVLVGQQRLEIGDPQRRQPGAQLGQGERS